MSSLAGSLSSHDDDCMSSSDDDCKQSSIFEGSFYGSNVESAINQQNNSQLVRKRTRQRLDHLTQAEKMLRRKMKNRIAAQTARDKKRAMVDKLEEENRILKAENERLRRKLASHEFNSKKNQDHEYATTTPIITAAIDFNNSCQTDTSIIKPSETLPEIENNSNNQDRTSETPIETAALVNVPRQKEQGATMFYPTSLMNSTSHGWTPVQLALLLTILRTHQYSMTTKCSAHFQYDTGADAFEMPAISAMWNNKNFLRHYPDSKILTMLTADNKRSKRSKVNNRLPFRPLTEALYSKRKACKMKRVKRHHMK